MAIISKTMYIELKYLQEFKGSYFDNARTTAALNARGLRGVDVGDRKYMDGKGRFMAPYNEFITEAGLKAIEEYEAKNGETSLPWK